MTIVPPFGLPLTLVTGPREKCRKKETSSNLFHLGIGFFGGLFTNPIFGSY